MNKECKHVFESVKNIDTNEADMVCKKCGLIKPKKYKEDYFRKILKKFGRN